MKILIIGGGAWGSALGNVLTENNKHDVTIFDRNIKVVDEINKLHTNSTYFNNVKLNASLKATHSYQEILNTVDLVVLAIPSNAYKDILIDLNNNLKKKYTYKVKINDVFTYELGDTVELETGIYGIDNKMIVRKAVIVGIEYKSEGTLDYYLILKGE